MFVERPLIEDVHFCPEIHGNDGLGELHLSPSTKRSTHISVAAVFIVDAARRVFESSASRSATTTTTTSTTNYTPERLTIVALAPLTNLALALRLDPTLATRIDRIVLMGGASRSGGNATPWAEANIRDDPEAAHIVFTSGIDIVMYPWDVFEQFNFDRAAAEQFASSANEWSQLAGNALYAISSILHFKRACLIVSLLTPGTSLFETERQTDAE